MTVAWRGFSIGGKRNLMCGRDELSWILVAAFGWKGRKKSTHQIVYRSPVRKKQKLHRAPLILPLPIGLSEKTIRRVWGVERGVHLRKPFERLHKLRCEKSKGMITFRSK